MPGSSPAARARRPADLASRRRDSSARMSSRKSACGIFCWRARVSRSGKVASIWPSLSARSGRAQVRADRIADGGGHRVACFPAGDERELHGRVRYSAGSRANRARGRSRERRRGRGVLGCLLQHRGDLGDVDDVEFERALAGGVDRAGPVTADQPEQPVNLPHPGPRQVGVEQPFGVDADGVAVPAGGLGQRGHVPHRVGALLRGQVGGVGDPPAGLGRGWALTSCPR